MKFFLRNFLKLSAMALLLPCLPAFAEEQGRLQVEINKGQMIRFSRAASSVMVADPGIADIQVVSPKLVYVNGKKIGETSLVAVDAQDNVVLSSTVEVTHNLSKLKQAVKTLVPKADIDFTTVDGGLVINGFVDSPMESESIRSLANTFLGTNQTLVNMLSVGGSDQVTLQVKVVEVSRNALKRFGIHLENVIDNIGEFSFTMLSSGAVVDAAGDLIRNGDDYSLFLQRDTASSQLNQVIDALEDEGLISTLAEPSLTTASGKTANFLAGGEFPVPSMEDGSVQVEYKAFGISLDFTPTVLNKDRISLNVAPEVSNLSQTGAVEISGFSIPSLITRRAQATVELGSGQTFAIAGLLKNDRSNDISKFPGLGDVPVLGMLFRSHEFRNDQTELVILVTPYIVRGVSDRKSMATPLDGYVPPTNLDRILKGKMYREQPPTAMVTEASAPQLRGDGGFILE